MEIKIYGLVDPRNNEIRYVGQTKRKLEVRLSRHMLDKPRQNNHKYNWICSLKKENLKPIIIELETCDDTNWKERERHWIGRYSNLTNLTAGGDGVDFYPQEVRDKISKGNKKAWENPEYRKNISKKRKEYWLNPENRINHSLKTRGKHRSKDICDNITKRNLEMWKTPEYREKMTKSSNDKWKDPEYKEKVFKYLKSDKKREMLSKLLKDKPRTEEIKKKISDGCDHKQQISVNGIIYDSIIEASKQIPMNRGKLRTRLNSKHFPEYYKIKKED